MRLLSHLPDENGARALSDYMYVQGITNTLEEDPEGWALWVHAEEELPRAREILQAYQANPSDPRYHQHTREARRLKEQEEREEAEAEKRYFDRKRVFRNMGFSGVTPVAMVLILLCVFVHFMRNSGNDQITGLLKISASYQGLPEIRQGEIWRLVTPAFMHAHFPHLFFNLLWLFDLGAMVESRRGPFKLLVMVVAIAAVSNIGQWYMSGPNFMGMSGVVYGLLGYVWMKGKYDPGSGLFMHQQTVTMMLIWFFLCLFEVIPNVANTAHAVGLLAGMAWGYVSSLRRA